MRYLLTTVATVTGTSNASPTTVLDLTRSTLGDPVVTPTGIRLRRLVLSNVDTTGSGAVQLYVGVETVNVGSWTEMLSVVLDGGETVSLPFDFLLRPQDKIQAYRTAAGYGTIQVTPEVVYGG